MCRILYLPPGQKHGRGWLAETATQLYAGNRDGIGWLDAPRGRVSKGVDFAPTNLAALWTPGREALVHFRLASAGGKHDSLCHPFRAGRHGWLVHNGHWGAWSSIPEKIFDRWLGKLDRFSDTARIAQMVARYGPGLLGDIGAGVFLLHRPGRVRLWKSSGSFGWGRTTDGIYFASERLPGTKEWAPIGDATDVSLLDVPLSDLPKEKYAYTPVPWRGRVFSGDAVDAAIAEWEAEKAAKADIADDAVADIPGLPEYYRRRQIPMGRGPRGERPKGLGASLDRQLRSLHLDRDRAALSRTTGIGATPPDPVLRGSDTPPGGAAVDGDDPAIFDISRHRGPVLDETPVDPALFPYEGM